MCVTCPTPVGDSEDDELVVEPTHLKNMRPSNWIISKISR